MGNGVFAIVRWYSGYLLIAEPTMAFNSDRAMLDRNALIRSHALAATNNSCNTLI